MVTEPVEACWHDATEAAKTIFTKRFSADAASHAIAAPSGYATVYGEIPLLVQLQPKQTKHGPACEITVGFARDERQTARRARNPFGMNESNFVMLHDLAFQFKDLIEKQMHRRKKEARKASKASDSAERLSQKSPR